MSRSGTRGDVWRGTSVVIGYSSRFSIWNIIWTSWSESPAPWLAANLYSNGESRDAGLAVTTDSGKRSWFGMGVKAGHAR